MILDYSYIDKAFINGRIITVNAQDDICEAVGIKKNKIVFVGTNEEIKSLIDENTEILDLKGRAMTPGFIDSHYHPILSGFMNGAIIDATYPKCKSIEDIKALVRERAKATPKGNWIKLWGYDNNKLREKRHVTLEDLDDAAPEHPVQCMRTCGHVCIYNTLGLAAGDIKTPEDIKRFGEGEIEVIDGKFTGLTRDLSAFYLWSKVKYTDEELRDAIERANKACLEGGITSVHDCGECDAPAYSMMFKAAANGWFKPRQFMMLHSIFGKPFSKEDNEHFLNLGFHTGLGNQQFRIGSCKFMVDGGSSGPTMATREPYSHNPDLPRILSWEREEVAGYIDYINKHDCQATAHAEGDLAVEFMVEGYEKALKNYYRKPEEHRHRIEHCVIVDDDLIQRMKAMGIIPVANTHFIPLNGSDYHRYFGERINYLFALRSFIDAGLRPAIGCDAPTAACDAIAGLDGAVNRIDRGTGEVCGPGQRISMLEAIRCYTLNGAYASFEDDIKGSIEIGKLADFTVFSDDILAIDPVDIVKTKVDYTIIDGEIYYKRGEN
ncbi:hypothetical protein C818_01685 [Lachnospiraceae bacterium MD308]|jgi:Predicted metal-dependent hydrolase with the TIM-barrel fold|nr:hypothetical protein C818_01685 [Lachnospiraceae bacterium MD308]